MPTLHSAEEGKDTYFIWKLVQVKIYATMTILLSAHNHSVMLPWTSQCSFSV